MKVLVAVLTILIAIGLLAPERAEAQSACEHYRVKKGDTLRKISKRAYGREQFRMIYRANARRIGRNPDIISIGTVIRIPCRDGSFPVKKTEQAAAPENGTISFATANGYLPYTDESLPARGLFTHLVDVAMARAAPDQAMEIVFVNDWSAHLEHLLPRQAFDASFPWTRPGCETQGELTSVELYACQNYIYSEPFYEIVEGFFARADTGHAAIIDFAGLKGTRICRPEGYSTGHLEENGLMPPDIVLVQPAGAHDCFAQLMDGAVDLVALDTRTGERIRRDLGVSFDVVENPHLFSLQPLQVAVHKDNPKSDAIIEALNKGRRNMLESGEWDAIVSGALQVHAEALMN